PVKFSYGEEYVNCVYIYGAATTKQYQNRGLMTKLLAQAEDISRSRGAELCVLVPGETYLYKYYKDRGYSSDFNVREVVLKSGMINSKFEAETPVEYDTISASNLYDIRKKCLSSIPYIEWTAKQLEFVIDDALIYGDHVASYFGDKGRSYAFYSMRKKTLYIKECCGTTEESELLLIKDIVMTHTPKKVLFHLPMNAELFKYEGEVVRCGMSKPLNINAFMRDLGPYMNLMLD
ncbi:MAG: GNAT family N-acetyltransferase, partial [Oscillospiraceae bacterium]